MVPWGIRGKTGGEGTGSGAWAMPTGCAHGHTLHPDPHPNASPRATGHRQPRHQARLWGAFRHRQRLSPERQQSKSSPALQHSAARRHPRVLINHPTAWGETWFFHQVEENPPALANCRLALLPQHTSASTVSRRCWLRQSQRWSWQRAQPTPAPPYRPHTLTGTSCSQLGGSPGGSPLSHQPPATPCALTSSLAFTTEPLEWAQGTATVLALRLLQDSPSSPSPCPGAAPAQAAQLPASVSPLGEGSPLQPIPAVSKQPLMDAARAAHD